MEITKDMISGAIGNTLSVSTARDLGCGYKIYPVLGKVMPKQDNPAGCARHVGFQLVYETDEDGIPFTRHVGRASTVLLSCNENGALLVNAALDDIERLSLTIESLIRGDRESA